MEKIVCEFCGMEIDKEQYYASYDHYGYISECNHYPKGSKLNNTSSFAEDQEEIDQIISVGSLV